MLSPALAAPSPVPGTKSLIRFACALAVLVIGVPFAASAQLQVSARGDTTCAAVGGAAYCWGYNTDGQVGNNSTSHAPAPVQVQGLASGVSAVETGGGHSCAIVNGGAWCWGNNAYGQLGNNGSATSSVPVPVSGLSSGVTAIALGDLHTCAIVNGGARCWGSGGVGQLGTGGSIFSSPVPVAVSGLASNVTALSTGKFHSCAVMSGASYCWGQGDSGELGNGLTTYIVQAPVAVSGYSTASAVISAGAYFTCGIRNAGAQCWGYGSQGRLGNGGIGNSSLPQQVVGLTAGVTAISAGNGLAACAVVNGAVQCWGANNAGQLGNPGAGAGGSTVPVAVQGLTSGMQDVSAGGLHACATGDSGLYCWGSNAYGQLGTGTGTASGVPVLILTAPAPPADPPRLANISTRMQVLTGNDVMIGGFIIGGSTAKTVLIRARGPSMIPAGVTNALPDPEVTLVNSSQTIIASNDDWNDAANAGTISTTGLAPTNALESAILVTLQPGAYTAVVSGFGGVTGVGIVEVFEIDSPEVPLTNISTRGRVLTGDNVMIGGFIIDGSGPKTVLIRARGPSMIPAGVTDALANPQVTLVNSSQVIVASNDNWGSATNAADISATGLAPTNSLESAILITLNPGAYTVVVSGVGGLTGVGIVEVFAE